MTRVGLRIIRIPVHVGRPCLRKKSGSPGISTAVEAVPTKWAVVE